MRRTSVSLALAVALMVTLPVAASPDVGSASPGSLWSSGVAKVVDAFAGLWAVVASEVTASPAPTKNDDDDREDPPPIDGLGAGFELGG